MTRNPQSAALALKFEAEAQRHRAEEVQHRRDWVWTAGRVALAGLFLWMGLQKAMSFEEARLSLSSAVSGSRGVLATAIGIEVIGGVLLAMGMWTRRTAGALAGYVAFANAVMFLSRELGATAELAVTNLGLIGGLLLLAAHGGGRLSLDSFTPPSSRTARSR